LHTFLFCKYQILIFLSSEEDELMELADYFAWKGEQVEGLRVTGQYSG
jgi:hypothetical protein